MPFGDSSEPQVTKIAEANKSHGDTDTGLSLIGVMRENSLPTIKLQSEMLSTSQNGGTRSVENLAAVYADLIPGIPAAVASKLKADVSERPFETAVKFAESTAFGVGTAVLLAKSPVLAKTLLTGAGLSATALALNGTYHFSAEALSANTPEERARLSLSGRTAIGTLGADLLESTPGLLLGTGAGLKLASKVPSLASISTAVRDFGELRARALVPEGMHYLSFDARTVETASSKLASVAASGESNLLTAGQEMLKVTPWRGVEEGRFFKSSGADKVKMSARLPGDQFEVYMGRRSEQMFHTHESRILPTSGDFNTVHSTGVIGVPGKGVLTFYEGTGREAEKVLGLLRSGDAEAATKAAEALHGRTFKTLVVDPAKELSVRVDLRWNAEQNGMMPTSIRPIDYADTVKNLSKWKGQLNISQMESSAEALLKPGMTDLIKHITAGN